jgi:hypothetical protein
MKIEQFKKWLKKTGYKDTVVNSRAGNCNKVSKYEGDLDLLFAKDECADLLARLNYTTDDERNNRKVKHKVPINGNKRTGSATLKSAVSLYVDFLKGSIKTVKPVDMQTRASGEKVEKKNDWPVWDAPADDECYQLAQISTRYIRFLSPEIIRAVVEDNEKNKEFFWEYLRKYHINPSLYLWEKSSCCFPGIRRYAGSSEIAAFRKRSKIESVKDAISLDDNDFPKQLWSFVFRNAQFSKQGPTGYNLAHLIDHKDDKNRYEEEFDFEDGRKPQKAFYGLYTCASNAVYIPSNLMKPTDFNGAIRNLLFKKAQSLYGSICNIVPPNMKIKNIGGSKWNIDKFKWADPVGTMENVERFLKYRKKKIDDILKKNEKNG